MNSQSKYALERVGTSKRLESYNLRHLWIRLSQSTGGEARRRHHMIHVVL